ncbi:hypothetical protein H4CHR_03413 [Variovorax sp. PBS-H4]|uniref:SRPBCC family protein n=1 Tax=Variovorax sp. PBS-H4 TaxID=434008 RepID=UPI0013173BB0|nr:SRPBCC family protein [Variovorax sp. PBS-H4]VTU34432.1 hypothetical protein H4CHR_03413 [Variovorax sp. PBS-H4]
MALTICSSFSLDAPKEEAWRLLTDIERAAPCFPGAQLLNRNEDGSWKANFVVKLGPMSFSFAGRFLITEADAERGHLMIKAQGSDTKGRGGANATVDVELSGGDSRTEVNLTSTVDLSGAVAQFGRGAGMIEALSRQLVDQFAINLRRALPARGTATANVASPGVSAAQSLDGTALLGNAMLAAFKAWLRRLFGRHDSPRSN